MSKQQLNVTLHQLIVAATVLFVVFELIVAGGFIELEQVGGFFANLRAGGERWYENPIPWVIVLVVFVNFVGFMENYSRTREAYDKNKFMETWFKYLPMVVFFSQLPWATLFGLPDEPHTNIAITSALALAIDIISRALKSGKTTVVQPALVHPTPPK